ncbi:class A beta-lactamase-related serine hydrolase [bacterium]|nr:class A beta-lactamase-related serine hydrolase [bacterium]
MRPWHCLILLLCMAGRSQAAGLADVTRPALDAGSLAGAVLLVTDRDHTLLHEAAGSADLASRRPMALDSLFWIASMTKPITAAAVMILVDEGKVRLDEPVARYLPEFGDTWVAVERDAGRMVLRRPARPITVRDLLAHTSGLPFKSPVETPTLDQLPLAVVARSAAQVRRPSCRSFSTQARAISIPMPASTPPAGSSRWCRECPTRRFWRSGSSSPSA